MGFALLNPSYAGWGLALDVKKRHYAERSKYVEELQNYQQNIKRLLNVNGRGHR